MQALDHLKTTGHVAVKARKAISVLHSAFVAKHPRVRGQTMTKVREMSSSLISRLFFCVCFAGDFKLVVYCLNGAMMPAGPD